MSKEAMLPCISCGKVLENTWDGSINQPAEGTEFQSFGHYGSTFWDAFHGEQIVINICDECLRTHTERIARKKAYRKIVVTDTRGTLRADTVVGRQWVHHEMVPYFAGPEDADDVSIEPEEIGRLEGYDRVEWVQNWRDIKKDLVAAYRAENGEGPCKHVRFVAECLDCGASPLQGLR